MKLLLPCNREGIGRCGVSVALAHTVLQELLPFLVRIISTGRYVTLAVDSIVNQGTRKRNLFAGVGHQNSLYKYL